MATSLPADRPTFPNTVRDNKLYGLLLLIFLPYTGAGEISGFKFYLSSGLGPADHGYRRLEGNLQPGRPGIWQ